MWGKSDSFQIEEGELRLQENVLHMQPSELKCAPSYLGRSTPIYLPLATIS